MNGMAKVLLWIYLGFLPSLLAAENVAVVVSATSPINTLEKSTVVDIFMGRYVAYPDGRPAVPLEVVGADGLRQDFYRQLVGMSTSKINAYWARLRFSGRQRPTLEKSSEAEITQYLAENSAAIGYLYKSRVTDDLKIVLELNE